MFRESTTQSSFFEVENYLPGVLPDADWCYIYKNKVLPLIDEKNLSIYFQIHLWVNLTRLLVKLYRY